MRLYLIIIALLGCTLAPRHAPVVGPGYFDRQRRGTNFFDEVETRERFHAAASQGIRLVRLVPDKWKGAGRDFLLGSADDFRALVPEDLAKLRTMLDAADAEGVKVVLGLLSLPGARWRQHNGNRSDFRLYRERKFQAQAIALWRSLASALKGHPAIVAYNPINEPHPERSADTAAFDLSSFYRRIVAAIRSVDPNVAIVLDAGDFASPKALAKLTPLADARVLYAFHMYEPWLYIDHASKGRYRYPGEIDAQHWDAAALARVVEPVVEWQKKHRIPSSRIFAAEFGCPRTHPGVEQWMADVIRIFDERGWHWAFYSFREDTWHAMNYELGTKPPPWKYWQDIEAGKSPELARVDNPIWKVIRAEFDSR